MKSTSLTIVKTPSFDVSYPLVKKTKYRYGDICWKYFPTIPLEVDYYFTVRGAESLHLYLWVIKDISWIGLQVISDLNHNYHKRNVHRTQDWYVSGFIFGILAVMWSVFLLNHAIHRKNIKEFWTCVGQFLWLFANLWWMTGELHDFAYPDAPPQYPQRTIDARHIMESALIWLGIYYLSIKPFKIWAPTPEAEREYDIKRLKSRFPRVFETWREYENVHIFFWLGKDYGWNRLNPFIWITALTPTLLIALDFVWISLFDPRLLIEHCHYIAQFTWVMGNMVWALGEIFFPANDYPYQLFSSAPTRLIFCRWYSSWVLVSAFIPIIALYIIWIRGYRKGMYNYEKTWKPAIRINRSNSGNISNKRQRFTEMTDLSDSIGTNSIKTTNSNGTSNNSQNSNVDTRVLIDKNDFNHRVESYRIGDEVLNPMRNSSTNIQYESKESYIPNKTNNNSYNHNHSYQNNNCYRDNDSDNFETIIC